MYKLLHLVFGWDYIHWRSSSDQGVSRVFHAADGTPIYWRYKNTCWLGHIQTAADVTWLTCAPEKYLKPIGERK